MIVEKILELPAQITLKVEGVDLYLKLFKNHSYELRMCYLTFNDIYFDEPWSIDRSTSFLFLIENISTDQQLIRAVGDMQAMLEHYNRIFRAVFSRTAKPPGGGLTLMIRRGSPY